MQQYAYVPHTCFVSMHILGKSTYVTDTTSYSRHAFSSNHNNGLVTAPPHNFRGRISYTSNSLRRQSSSWISQRYLLKCSHHITAFCTRNSHSALELHKMTIFAVIAQFTRSSTVHHALSLTYYSHSMIIRLSSLTHIVLLCEHIVSHHPTTFPISTITPSTCMCISHYACYCRRSTPISSNAILEIHPITCKFQSSAYMVGGSIAVKVIHSIIIIIRFAAP